MARNNPLVTKSGLRKRVDGQIVAAQIRLTDARRLKGKKREEMLCNAYARAETARYIAGEIADYREGEDKAFAIQEEIWRLRDATGNPMPGVPGGGISECIAEMSTRPDVDDPGALCASFAQQRGEYGWRSLPRIKRGGKKTSKGLRSLMRKALT